MHWSFLQAHWPDLYTSMARAFPALRYIETPTTLSDAATLSHRLAKAHDLTLGEVSEMIEDVVLQAQAAQAGLQVSDVTHKIVASS